MGSPNLQLLMGQLAGGESPVGQQEYTSPGSYNWTAPDGVTLVCVVAVGTGGSWKQKMHPGSMD